MLLDKTGKILIVEDLRDGMDLGDKDLRGAIFSGKDLHGLELSGADLREADLSDSYLYWLDLFAADCSGASFRGAILEGANLKSACLRYVDFTGTIIKADQLARPSSLAHADLSGAVLVETVLEGTEYDAETIFPVGFDPERHGMTLVPIVHAWLVKPACKSSLTRSEEHPED